MRRAGPALGLIWVLLPTPARAEAPWFIDRAGALGIDFEHRAFAEGYKYMPENMGAGVAVLDVDDDGDLDLVFVQGGPVATPLPNDRRGEALHQLFLQQADGRFRGSDLVAARGEEAKQPASGMGVTFGDVDGDGDLDLYVSRYGGDQLLLARGDGTYDDATSSAGLGKRSWSTGATFFDADADGDLDLYVASYVDFALDNHKFCGDAARDLRSYCHPDVYDALPDALFLNDGEGRFVESSRSRGVLPSPDGKGLGVIAADFDDDGHQDLFVANDSTANFLYLGDGGGRFEESALLAGLALSGTGAAEASMGIARGDFDGDGRLDLLLTHLDQETNTLYRPIDAGLFLDATDAAGLGPPSLPWVGFGAVALDADLDGDLDLAIANGHILDNIALFAPERRHRQPVQLFENRGGRFVEKPEAFGGLNLVGRGLAAGDLDRDGDDDLVLTQNDGPALVLLNTRGDRARAAGARSLTVTLQGTASNPQGFGSRLELKVGDDHHVRELLAGSSYLSQSAPEVIFGLPPGAEVGELVVRWPSGQVDRRKISAQDIASPRPLRVVESALLGEPADGAPTRRR
ncbi:MAG: CRTAC1 family protein [Acidobacteriota bacterium]